MKFLFSGDMDKCFQNAFDIDTNHLERGNNIMGTFNDIGFYNDLRNNYMSAEISTIRVRHNNFCQGIQVLYRCTNLDASTMVISAPEHFFSDGPYVHTFGSLPTQTTELSLTDGEYIRGLRLNQGDIVDGITIVTNQREVHFGGQGGNYYEEQMVSDTDSSHGVVAFAGRSHGVLKRIGCYYTGRNGDHVEMKFLFSDYMHRNFQNAFDIDTNHLERGNNIMGTFNDIGFYNDLRNNYMSAEISTIRIRHNNFCQGIQVLYRCTNLDASTMVISAPEHFFSDGPYVHTFGSLPTQTTELSLTDGEYIRGLRLNQGDIVDGITIVTNQREVHFGGQGGNYYEEQMVSDTDSSHGVVAFAGRSHGVLKRIGCYYARQGWCVVRNHVMLRWLLDHKRALYVGQSSDDFYCYQYLVQNQSDDIFRHVLQFL